MTFDKRFFIHIPKNAGMTIRKSPYLSNKIVVASPDTHKNVAYTNSLNMKMASLGDHHGHEHARWRDLSIDVQNKYKFFAIIRNPWDRVVSRFFFAKKVIEVEKKVPVSYADVSSFEAFLEERHKWGNEKYMWHRAVRGWYPAYDHVTDVDGNIKCDILRFDHLDEDVGNYFNIPKNLKARNVTNLNSGTYMDLYTPKTIQIVGDWYKKDVDTWGFDFDTGPMKNYWSKMYVSR